MEKADKGSPIEGEGGGGVGGSQGGGKVFERGKRGLRGLLDAFNGAPLFLQSEGSVGGRRDKGRDAFMRGVIVGGGWGSVFVGVGVGGVRFFE